MISKLLKSEKAIKVIVFIGIFVIICIFLLSLTGKSSNKPEESVKNPEICADEYASELENNLKELLSKISGTGEISVLLTLEKSSEDIYSQKETNISTTISPKIRGAVVVCKGAENAVVREKLVEAVSKALGIGVNRICVTY